MTTEQHPARTPLANGPATLLVAEREISTQMRSKAFIISLAVMVVFVIGGIIAMSFFTGDDDPEPVATVGFSEQATALDSAGLDPQPTGTMDAAETLLRDGDVEAIITSDNESPTGVSVIGLNEEPSSIAGMLAVTPTTEVLDADSTEGGLRAIVAMGFGMVFMIVALGSGMMIVQNTVQEKQNRIVDCCWLPSPPVALLAGKILGNSRPGPGSGGGVRRFRLRRADALRLAGCVEMLTVPMLWFVVFFVPGFVLVAAMFAASASLVSRQEDSGTVITPAMMLVMAPYFVVVFFFDNAMAMTIASYVPFSAPVAMPLRMFFNDPCGSNRCCPWASSAITTVLVMRLAVGIYSRSLLTPGQPLCVANSPEKTGLSQ